MLFHVVLRTLIFLAKEFASCVLNTCGNFFFNGTSLSTVAGGRPVDVCGVAL